MDNTKLTPIFPMPMRGLLLLTGMYSFAWSAFFRYFGGDVMRWLAMNPTEIPEISGRVFGTVGMLIGFLIFLSAFYPISWHYLMMIGIAGKLILAAWFVLAFIPELGWNKRSIFHLVFNELIWLIPLTIILIRAIKVKKYLKDITD